MNDSTEGYMRRVQKRLARREDGLVARTAEVLCFPSFHPETLLRATTGEAGTSFRLGTFTSSLWYSEQEEPQGQRPRRVQEVASVPPDAALRFWDSIEDLTPWAVRAEKAIGLDGMTVRALYGRGEDSTSFETWSPAPSTLPGKFVGLIYDLAWEVMKEKVSIERLEQLYGYLRLGLPVRVIEGDVKRLRIFGSLSSSDRKALQSLFVSLRDEGPLVVDMTNFDGMGTRLYPTFVAFASERRPLAWACSSAARGDIESMGLENPQVFDDVDDAIRSLTRGPRPADAGGAAPG